MTTPELLEQYGPRESMDYDVVIVGAGPAGLAAAIHLKQQAQAKGQEISVCILEKGSQVGAHILAGSVMDVGALSELIPDWKSKGAPLGQPVLRNDVLTLTKNNSLPVPQMLIPHNLRNTGGYIIGLGSFVQWLAEQAQALDVEIFPGFAATEILYDGQGAVVGVATGDMGIGKDGQPTQAFQLGMELRAKYTIFAEGSRGHLGRELIERFKLDAQAGPQAYSIGIKELWEVDNVHHRPGTVTHTAGWPLDTKTYGGGFVYHMEGNKVAVGLVIGLDYTNPWLDPFEEMQRWKTHPAIRATLDGGKRIGFGARSITGGGLLSLPEFVFPGGVMVGCEAGFMNASRIKGIHTAIKSGMLAADAIFDSVRQGQAHLELVGFPKAFERSWLHEEMAQAKNFKQWFKKGQWVGSVMTGVEHLVLPLVRVNTPPWTIKPSKPNYQSMRPAAECMRVEYSKPDGKLTFDRLSSVYLSHTHHEENQPSHLRLKDAALAVKVNLKVYAGADARYCPAGVYEYIVEEGKEPHLQINASNCLHCKTCDIKDPMQNVVWVAPEGGGGPNYSDM